LHNCKLDAVGSPEETTGKGGLGAQAAVIVNGVESKVIAMRKAKEKTMTIEWDVHND
jgi:hypothetical protein